MTAASETRGRDGVPPRLRPPAHRVAPRAVVHWAIDYLLAWGLAFALALGAAAWLEGARWDGLPDWAQGRLWWLPALVGAAGLATVLVAPAWRYRVHRWEVSADVVYTRTGWFAREWLLVPVSRIQTVDTEQGLVERLLGLATLQINTASHAGSSQVAGLPVDVATRLAAELARRAHDLRDDAT
ncbi:PH domain-containing protein [Thermomonospora amylolytica]|uniref:PH domain-containing protein n=1 Tax=Thermomonospora amylolytica TaxID=1411117 RepID=UPI000E6C29DD|nr:PH domain-containing protein [Thermomonospora amylolytica]